VASARTTIDYIGESSSFAAWTEHIVRPPGYANMFIVWLILVDSGLPRTSATALAVGAVLRGIMSWPITMSELAGSVKRIPCTMPLCRLKSID